MSTTRHHDDALLEGLTEAQREAVTHGPGPLLVLAGPGSGKTTVVTKRVAHLIGRGVPPWQILALTFTNKAAAEMRERVDRLLPEGLAGRRGLTIATFHSFCARLLRRYSEEAGIAERFSIYDAADQRDAIRQAIAAAELSEKNFSRGAVGSAISNAKNKLLDAATYASEARDFYSRAMARAYTAYERILRSNDALDFDDLLLRTAHLLRTDDTVRGELQARFEHLLVDEYQDTNHAQFVIAGELASARRNICVVGDPDQSIYGWRGADIRNILEFEEQYPEAKVIPLGQNFRSTGHIVATADHLIRNNRKRKHKDLHTDLDDGDRPEIHVCFDERHEASVIVDLMRRRHDEQDMPWKSMAVLYRMNALSRVLEDAFRDGQIPYVIARGTAFYERKEIKDALAYLRLIANPNDEVALRRIVNTPPRGIGATTLDRIEQFATSREIRFSEALHRAGEVDGLSKRAAAAVGKFVALVDQWRAAAEQRPADVDGGAPGLLPVPSITLAELVERVVRESGMEKVYRSSPAEEDLERLENLEELVSAAAQFVPAGADADTDYSLRSRSVAPAMGDRSTGATDRSTGATDRSTGATDRSTGATDDERSESPVRTSSEADTVLDRLGAWLETVALVSDADMVDPANGAVTLMTLHAAKGLEFDTVAIVGLEEGLLPHYRAAESEAQLEEERRLCFVGITRAERRLVLSRAITRTHRGLRERTIESRFLAELPADATRREEAAMDEFSDPGYGSGQGPGADLPAGTLVRHPTFGLGRVETVMARPAGASARITFETVGPKTLILEYARLERVDF
ncbi:MAG: ATP-dependent helicase [Planctomycetota bacterium]|jgi:DNA helicase-2/ATP-dependent DNA helicase PcrA